MRKPPGLQRRRQAWFLRVVVPAFRDVVAEVPEPLRPEPRGPTLGRLIEAYEADPGRAGVTAKTRLDYAFAYRVA